jgi:hypothetical protein
MMELFAADRLGSIPVMQAQGTTTSVSEEMWVPVIVPIGLLWSTAFLTSQRLRPQSEPFVAFTESEAWART